VLKALRADDAFPFFIHLHLLGSNEELAREGLSRNASDLTSCAKAQSDINI
jgi:hypothetical protein